MINIWHQYLEAVTCLLIVSLARLCTTDTCMEVSVKVKSLAGETITNCSSVYPAFFNHCKCVFDISPQRV